MYPQYYLLTTNKRVNEWLLLCQQKSCSCFPVSVPSEQIVVIATTPTSCVQSCLRLVRVRAGMGTTLDSVYTEPLNTCKTSKILPHRKHIKLLKLQQKPSETCKTSKTLHHVKLLKLNQKPSETCKTSKTYQIW